MTAWTGLSEKLGMNDRTTWRSSLAAAVAFDITQHLRNRLALALVFFFIPVWIGLVKAVLPDKPVDYHSRVAERVLTVRADELITISGAINAVTLIVGFMMFAAVRRSGEFDRRLALAGYPRSALLVAKLTGLLLASGVVAAYAAAVMTLYWDPRHVWLIGFSLFVAGLTYGGMGFVLGIVLPTELSGMFVIIMVSLVEVMAQNPVTNPSSNLSLVRILPTYGPMQAGTTAGFTDQTSPGYALMGMLWLAAFGFITVIAFHRRTKNHVHHDSPAVAPAPIPAVVTLTTRHDGSFEVHSTTGLVVHCANPSGCHRHRANTDGQRH
jgi:ABC-2 type transport system permease protein